MTIKLPPLVGPVYISTCAANVALKAAALTAEALVEDAICDLALACEKTDPPQALVLALKHAKDAMVMLRARGAS